MAEVNNNALLLFQVGPVLCCAPTQRVAAIIEPRPLTRPPGASPSQPGIFKHAGHIVTSRDLRYHFGVTQQHWKIPGRIIIATLAQGSSGFFVDDIIAVISMPSTGWGTLPALIPRSVFSRALLLDGKMYLYTDFDKLDTLREQGCLRLYLQQLLAQQEKSSVRESPARVEASSCATSTNLRDQTLPAVIAVTPPINTMAHTSNKTSARRLDMADSGKKPVKHSLSPRKGDGAPALTAIHKPNVIQPGTALLTEPLIQRNTTSSPIHTETTAPSLHRTANVVTMQHPRLLAKQKTAPLVAAMIVLVLIGGIFSFFFNSPISRNAKTTPAVAATAVVASQPSSIKDEPVRTSSVASTATPYQATIMQDNGGITIVLNAPAQESVFAVNEKLSVSDASPAQPIAPQQSEIIHIVTKGDTLWHIAKQYVNNPFRYPELARLSNIKNPDLIYPGNRVRIIHRE